MPARSAAPTYLEFSTYLQLAPGFRNNNVTMLTAPGPSGEFYIAGTLGGSLSDLAGFPKQPINGAPFVNFNSIAFVARFSSHGELLDWRLLWNQATSLAAFLPRFLAQTRSGRVLIVITGTSALVEPPTDGAAIPSRGGPSLLVLSSDLREVKVSTYLAPDNTALGV